MSEEDKISVDESFLVAFSCQFLVFKLLGDLQGKGEVENVLVEMDIQERTRWND